MWNHLVVAGYYNFDLKVNFEMFLLNCIETYLRKYALVKLVIYYPILFNFELLRQVLIFQISLGKRIKELRAIKGDHLE